MRPAAPAAWKDTPLSLRLISLAGSPKGAIPVPGARTTRRSSLAAWPQSADGASSGAAAGALSGASGGSRPSRRSNSSGK